MRTIAILVLLLLLPLVHSDNTTCIACATFANASQAHILPVIDDNAKNLELNVYYEDINASPSRVPINSTIIIVEVTNSTGYRRIYKTYTDDQGKAIFNFGSALPNGYDGCIDMKSLYCPFCDPSAPACGFGECLLYSKINGTAGYYSNSLNPAGIISAADIPDASNVVTVPSPLNANRYLPDVEMTSYCTPPKPFAATPALCLPLLIIFSLLSGALYLTGRNPFAGFNIGGQRVGRHIRYQARGRGFSFSVMSAISAVTTVTDSVKAGAKGELGKREAAAAKNRVFAVGGMMASSEGRTKMFSAFSTASKAAGKSKGGLASKINTFGRVTESGMSRTSGASRGPTQQATSGGGMVMTPGGGGSTLRASDLSANRSGFFGYILNVGQAIGTVALFLLGNSNVGRCLTSMYSWTQWSGDSYSESFSLTSGLVRHDARARTDLQALRDVVGSGSTIAVDLPGGQQGQARNIEITRDRDGNITGATIVLDPMPGAEARGPITVKMNGDGRVTEMSFTVPKVENGQPVLDAQGRQVQVTMIGRLDAQGQTQYFTREGAGPEVAVDATHRVDVIVGSGAGQHTEHENIGIIMASNMPVTLGRDASDLLSSAANTQSTLNEINGSLQAEVKNVRAEIDSHLRDEATRNPDVQHVVDGQRYDVSTRELALALGFSETDLRTGGHTELFSGLGEHGHERAVEGIGQGWNRGLGATDSSGTPTFSRSAAERTGVGEDSVPYVAAALDRIVTSNTLDGLTGMGQKSTQEMRQALIDNLAHEGPGGVTREVATTMVHGMSDDAVNGLRSSLVMGARDTRAAMTAAGLPDTMVRELSQVQTTQVASLARTAGEIGDPAAMLARDPNNYNIPANVRGMLEERDHAIGVERGAQAAQNVTTLPSGETISRLNADSLGAIHYSQDQFDRLSYSSAAHNTQGSNIFQVADPVNYQTGRTVSEELSSGTSDMAAGARYGSRFAAYDLGAAQEYGQQEQHARDDVLSQVNSGNFDSAGRTALIQADRYTRLGDHQAAEAWTNIATEVNSLSQAAATAQAEGRRPPWESSPQAAAMGPGAIAATMANAPPADELGRRAATIEGYAGQEAHARTEIGAALGRNDYAGAEALIADRVRYYREVGDERSALVYELAQTQLSGLRRDENIRPGYDPAHPPSNEGGYFDPTWYSGADQTQRQEAFTHARDQVLSDLGITRVPGAAPGQPDRYESSGGLGGDALRMTGHSVGQSFEYQRRGESTIMDATTRMDGELSARGRVEEGVRGMRQGPRRPEE